MEAHELQDGVTGEGGQKKEVSKDENNQIIPHRIFMRGMRASLHFHDDEGEAERLI